MAVPRIPRAQTSISQPPAVAGKPTGTEYIAPIWYDFLRQVLDFINASGLVDPGVIDSILSRLDDLEDDAGGVIVGPVSVQVLGTLAGGGVTIRLLGDESAPGNTYYYGTGPTGGKGWHTVASAFTATADGILLTTGADGVTDITPDDDLEAVEALTGDGFAARTGADAWSLRDLTVAAGELTVSNGDGVAGNPLHGLADTAVTPGSYGDERHVATFTVDQKGRLTAAGLAPVCPFDSTGVISGCALSIGSPTSTFTIASGLLLFMDYTDPASPEQVQLVFDGASNVTIPGIGSSIATYVGVDSSGTIIQSANPFTNTQRRTIAAVGVVIHSNLTVVNAVNDKAATVRSGVNQLQDLMEAIGPMNLDGNVFGPDGANLSMNKSAGTLFKFGANFQTNPLDPHVVSIGATTSLTFRYRLSTGTEGSDVTLIDPLQYESSPGTLSTVPLLLTPFSVQRITIFQTGLVRVQYGQAVYGSMSAAEDAIQTDPFTTETNIAQNGVTRAYLVVHRSCTNLNTATQAKFIPIGKFGAPASGGAAITAAAIIAALGYTPQPEDATLTALAAANWALNAVPIGTGADTLSQVAFAANTFPARASTGDLEAKTITDNALTLLATTTTTNLPEGTNLYFTDARARTAVITATITNGDTTHSPSGDAVFDALAGKDDAGSAAAALAAANVYTDDEIATREPTITAGTTAQLWRGDKAWTNWLDGDYRFGTSSGLFGSGREVVVSAGTSGDNIAHLSLQGSRTVNGTFAALHYYHQGNRVASMASFRDAADDAGAFAWTVKPTGGSLTNALRIMSDSTVMVGTAAASNGAGLLQIGGHTVPYTDNTVTLGASAHRWSATYTHQLFTHGKVLNKGIISPAQITSTQNDYAPTGYADCYIFRLDSDAARSVTGLQGGEDGREIVVMNIGAFNILLSHDTTSTAANRWLCPNNVSATIRPNGWVKAIYDSTSSRWRVMGA